MISNKAVSSFMENFMRMKLFFAPEYSRYEVCKFFEFQTRSHLSFEDKMSLIQLIITRGKEFILLKSVAYRDNDALAHVLHFDVDPVNSEQWAEFTGKFKEE